uniref:Uncharacterized protein n=1 Tax=Aegilops tauschii subsp. strangulata TaxID=200361 RepID=A0A453CG56_AEGTS
MFSISANAPVVDQNVSATIRMEMAVERGEALSVQVSMKHLVKSLQCHLAKPDCTFYGLFFSRFCKPVEKSWQKNNLLKNNLNLY